MLLKIFLDTFKVKATVPLTRMELKDFTDFVSSNSPANFHNYKRLNNLEDHMQGHSCLKELESQKVVLMLDTNMKLYIGVELHL